MKIEDTVVALLFEGFLKKWIHKWKKNSDIIKSFWLDFVILIEK